MPRSLQAGDGVALRTTQRSDAVIRHQNLARPRIESLRSTAENDEGQRILINRTSPSKGYSAEQSYSTLFEV
jgi:hypothetical protein